MKSRIVAMILLSIVIVMAVMGISVRRWGNSEAPRDKENVSLTTNTTPIRSEVMKDMITYTINMTGITDSFIENNFYEVINVSFDNADERKTFLCDYVAGVDICKGEKLYSFNGKDYIMEYDGRVADIVVSDVEARINVINYDKVYVKCLVSYQDIDTFKVGGKVSLWVNYINKEGETFDGTIEGIGSIVENNEVAVYIKPTVNLLPGVNVSGKYSYEKNVETLFVLKDMILSDGIEYYIQRIEESGEITRVQVELGEEFQVQNGEVITEYVEIFGDISEGERLTVDILVE